MRNDSDKSCWKNQDKHFMLTNHFYENCVVDEVMQDYGTARRNTEYNILYGISLVSWINVL